MSNYQVIARKWRPQRFADVVGQEHVLRTLLNAIISGRTAHAYLFVGSRGIGKTTLSRIFAKAMNCHNPQNGEPCCQCDSCLATAEDRNLDIIEIDAASRNTVGEMRSLTEEVLTAPVGGKYKIYIIDEVHMLSAQAWNVLLKTVEEPPSHVKFIFATTEVHKVLPTILSRCQRFDLQPIPTRLIAERLQLICQSENIAIEPEALMDIARSAEGGMRDAQSLLDQMIAFFSDGSGKAVSASEVRSLFGLTDRSDLESLMQYMLANDAANVVKLVNLQARRGKNLETLFDDLLSSLRALELCRLLDDPSDLIDETAETISRYREISRNAPSETLRILLENLAPVGRILHEALNKQIYLETILLKAMHEAHAVRMSDILDRLNQLRNAGELTFLEKLPVADTVRQADIQIKTPLPEPAAPAENEKNEPAPVIEPVSTREVDSLATVSQGNTVPQAETNIEITAVEPETIEPEEIVYAPENPENDPVAINEVVSQEPPEPAPAAAETTPDTVVSIDIYDRESYESESSLPMPEPVATDNSAEQLPASSPRESVLAHDPQALVKITKNPEVMEIADLFDAQVTDIHQPVKR